MDDLMQRTVDPWLAVAICAYVINLLGWVTYLAARLIL